MKVKYEATFKIESKEEIRERLEEAGAELVRPEFLMRRAVFSLPEGHEVEDGWLRIRDEGDKITMTFKVSSNNASNMDSQKEIEVIVSNFEDAVQLMEAVGNKRRALQESKRELWVLDGVEVTIDEWPFLEPYIEIEGKDEDSVRIVAEMLGFDFSEAYFGSVDGQYAEKYGISEDVVNNETPELTFDGDNPFI